MDTAPVQAKPSRRWFRVLRWSLVALAILIVASGTLFLGGWAYYRTQYPYGWSHCCLKGLWLDLYNYAQRHNGHFPTGAGCPEASLSLLYRENPVECGANILRGKTVPEEVVKDILERDGLLAPDSCGWHYVEGLTLADAPEIAIVWDKVGLDHNGRNLKGGHSVCYLSGLEEVVPASDWAGFLETQAQLMAKRVEAAKQGRPMLTAKIRLPSGEVVDHFDGPYSFVENVVEKTGSSSGFSGGGTLDASGLKWWHMREGETTLSLTLNGRQSKPARISVSGGVATPNSIVFEMQAEKGK
jgi:hypothetical protein